MTTDTIDQPGATGLLDSVTVDDPNAAPAANTQAAEIDHKAADTPVEPGKVPGAPIERPDWLPENFWNGEKGEANFEAMAKSWSDMRKLVSAGKHKTPDGGKYDTSSLGESPQAQQLAEFAAKHGLSQAAFDDLAAQAKEMEAAAAGPVIDTQQEMQALGPNANAIINGMVGWARGLVNKGVWGADDFEEFKIMGGTAKGMRALMKMREAYEGRIPVEAAPVEGAPSKEELYGMVADPKYKTDAAYRQKVERLFAQHMG
jgi:hypothetical protein